jgi:ABC-type branched-subunit amino acid transport system substrate-binding protein
MLLPLFEDESVLGVIGMNRTNEHTEKAILLLGDRGIPVLATTLTDTSLVDVSTLYFQLVPGHEKQADLVWQYAKTQKAPTLVIYEQKGADNYVEGLVGALINRKSLDVNYQIVPWNKVTDISPECSDSSVDNVAFYAGLGDYFETFLNRLRDKCGDLSKLPEVVGSDATARLFTSSKTRDSIPSRLTVSYVSLGAPAALAGPDCIGHGALPDELKNSAALVRFCEGYYKRFRRLISTRDLPGMERPTERMAVAYDAIELLRQAVMENQAINRGNDPYIPHRTAVAAELREMNRDGTTGNFNFGAGDRVANDRVIAILTFNDHHGLLTDTPRCLSSLGKAPDGADLTTLCGGAT